ncbi:uncharacterized protein LOC113206272 [Frankliniella occidentalis]|uniref:Uncharacterized protein LOC113206272 n=1 Tax=Frankliniella occidentalis TaxID=133901 RepID=A0A9C6XW95_FRAOC|nr:uncharacterized protein LOC113206272 [Frankliniella occidentalis]
MEDDEASKSASQPRIVAASHGAPSPDDSLPLLRGPRAAPPPPPGVPARAAASPGHPGLPAAGHHKDPPRPPVAHSKHFPSLNNKLLDATASLPSALLALLHQRSHSALMLACPPPVSENGTRERDRSVGSASITFVLVGSRHFVKHQINRVEFQPLSRLFALLVGVPGFAVQKDATKTLLQLWSRSWARAVVAVALPDQTSVSLFTASPTQAGNSSVWCGYQADKSLSTLYESYISLNDLFGGLRKLRAEGMISPVFNHEFHTDDLRGCFIRANLYVGTSETRCGGDGEPLETRVLRSIFEATAQSYNFHPDVLREGVARDVFPGRSTHSVGLALVQQGGSDVGLAPYLLTARRMRLLRATLPFLHVNAELHVRCQPEDGGRGHLSAVTLRLWRSGLLVSLGLAAAVTIVTHAALVIEGGRRGWFSEVLVESALDTWAMLCEVSKPSVTRRPSSIAPSERWVHGPAKDTPPRRPRVVSHSAPAAFRSGQPVSHNPVRTPRQSKSAELVERANTKKVWAWLRTEEVVLGGGLMLSEPAEKATLNVRDGPQRRSAGNSNEQQCEGGSAGVGQGRHRGTRNTVRWVSGAWLILVLNVNVVIKALLSAENATPKPPPRVSSVKDMLEGDPRLVIGLPSPIYAEFLRSRLRLPDHRLVVCADDDQTLAVQCEERFDTDEHFAVVKETVLPTGIKCLLSCHYALDIGMRQVPQVLYVRRTAGSLAAALDSTILRLHAAGAINLWLRRDEALRALRAGRRAPAGKDRSQAARLGVFDAFLCLGWGLGAASVAFLLELRWRSWRQLL